MKAITGLVFAMLIHGVVLAQSHTISTEDITHFWEAYDELTSAKSKADSISIIQQKYIDRATGHFKTFIRIRKFTAEEYVTLLGKYPQFWKSVRPLTENIANRKDEIEAVLQKFKNELPAFEIPDVCFAIGCLRTGGTTGDKLILIGSEIAAADKYVVKDELTPWLKSVIGNTGDIVSMVAHEAVHTRQKGRNTDLLVSVMNEGIADFVTELVSELNINTHIHNYGKAHACEIRNEFSEVIRQKSNDLKPWLYNGNSAGNRIADLGYYVGYAIAELYYNKQSDKQKALEWLLDRSKYRRIYELSGYHERCN
ncbi:MAG: hypothetical protein KF803_10745 [Cyclobacteriaceae bacterium]|nr:hypothetical protein [Cyclobacteriaceae bacterium]